MTRSSNHSYIPGGDSVGRNVPRIDARAKASGETVYAGDLQIPGMVYGKLLRSPYAHARIRSIDTSAARQLAGVVAVMVGEDILDINPYYGHAIKDRPIVAIDRVRFAGEPVAAVAAETLEIAAEAVELIEVDYDPLPTAISIDEALAEDAPHLHVTTLLKKGLFHGLGEFELEPGNICYHHSFARGDADALFAGADIVVEGEYTFPGIYQYAMETHTTIASWNPLPRLEDREAYGRIENSARQSHEGELHAHALRGDGLFFFQRGTAH